MSNAGNLIYQETTTTGTGNITLTAKTGFRAFNDQFSVATPFWYAIRDQTTGAYEVGVGELSSASVLVRSSVIQSSNANALVNFAAGTKDVICDVPASIQNTITSKVPYTGATADVDLGAFNLTATDISTALVTAAEFNFLAGLGQNVQGALNALLSNFDNYVPYNGATTNLDLGANDLICDEVNGVALTTAGSSSQYLSADGTYSTPAGGSGLTQGQLQATISGVV